MMINSVPQECLVAKCGGEVRIYNVEGDYALEFIFANYAISFGLKEKDALKFAELMKEEQSQNSGQSEQMKGAKG